MSSQKPLSGKTRSASKRARKPDLPTTAGPSTAPFERVAAGAPAAKGGLVALDAPVMPAASAAPHGGGLDRYDIAILRELQEAARLSNAELALRIGLSPAPTWRRVRWLEDQGYIRGYRAEIDRHKIGLGVLAFVRLDAERNTGEATRVLEEAIRRIPEVIACHYISGSGTFELQVMTTDLDAFSRLALETLLNLPNVKDIHTSFALGEVKAGATLPLGHLERR